MQDKELFHKNRKTNKYQLLNLERMDHVQKIFEIFTRYLTIFVKYTDMFWRDLTDFG